MLFRNFAKIIPNALPLFNTVPHKPPFFFRFLTIVMVLAILVQSGVVTATQVECFSSGKQSVYLGYAKSCCLHLTSEVPTFRAKCCDVEQQERTYVQINHDKELDFVSPDKTIHATYHTTYKSAIEEFVNSGLFDLPPPISIPQRIMCCVFRI